MEDLASDFLSTVEEAVLRGAVDDRDDETLHEAVAATDSAKKGTSLRQNLFKAASLQDKLLEKLISQMIPVDDAAPDQVPGIAGADDHHMPTFGERPGFTVTAMSNNFRRFNARIGVMFKFQARVLRVLSWRRPSHTLSLLAVYTFVCLDPYLLCVLPLAIALFGIFVPSFVARHPAPSSDPDRVRNLGYSPRGPPLAPARTVKPAKELSRDFFHNLGELQNTMDDFSVAHDKIVALVVPTTNFSDEALSSAIFVLLFAACVFMMLAAHLLPWRLLALAGGWAAIWSFHPSVARLIHQAKRHYMLPGDGKPGDGGKTAKPGIAKPINKKVEGIFDDWVRSDIILDEAPETREVEIFELQRVDSSSGEWEPWLFSPSPYDPLSAPRIAGERPRGTRFFEDVLAPDGWEWSEKKWALDLWSREWVEERIITGVEVETEGERWVYDIYSESDAAATAGMISVVVDAPSPVRNSNGHGGAAAASHHHLPNVSWEEGEEGMGRRGEWRRRRWVRMVKRKNVS
ncbi:Peroxin/Dysferlin domain-containing protein [Lasiosphaeria ovina]|uniref:Peroxin/Dysferlin domain-containing protein n=1 Tax=Lasiosphaeria ovina TaxID=92902 RepID=A0AAE0N7X8_9PEZI|nr:Peroxin/Dysferlin domain-containing protein [Lasiosphaeria ovina]